MPAVTPEQNRRRRLLACAGALLLIVIAMVVFRSQTHGEFYDTKVRLHSKVVPPSDDLILLAIDESSVRHDSPNGPWPWERYVHAGIAEYCREADVVAFDIGFFETEDLRIDQLFADAVADLRTNEGCHVVTLCYLFDDTIRRSTPSDLKGRIPTGDPDVSIPDAVNHLDADMPYDSLFSNLLYLAQANFPRDSYGEYAVVARWGDAIIPSLALAAVMARSDIPPDAVHLQGDRSLDVISGSYKLSPRGTVYYPVSGKEFEGHRYCTMSDFSTALNRDRRNGSTSLFKDSALGIEAGIKQAMPNDPIVRENRVLVVDESIFKDRIVLVGSTATGVLRDFEKSPRGEGTSGMFIHADMINNLLNRRQFWNWSFSWDLLPVLLLGFLPAFMGSDRPWRLFVGSLFVWIAYMATTIALLFGFAWLLPWLWPTLALIFSTVLLASLAWAGEQMRRRELEAMEASKQQFTDMLVHDLKGRISTMTMSLSLIEERVPEEFRPTKLFTTTNSSATRLLTQVNALLDIRKIEEGRMQLNLAPVNLREVIEEVVREYQPGANLINLSIVTHIDPGINRPAEIDADIFQRILANLIWNALQYAKRGSEVVVGVRPVTENGYEVYVANRGKTISPAVASKLFKPFSTGTNAEKNVKTVSTGLGLAFCRLAAEAHGGSVRLNSPWAPHEDGVEVVLRIPFEQP